MKKTLSILLAVAFVLTAVLSLTGCGKNREIFIGQGWKDQKLEGLGIGKCCRGASECVMGCPPTADQISKLLLK